MEFEVKISKKELIELVMGVLRDRLGEGFDKTKLLIETKSLQNYKSEWESADFRATYRGEA